MAGTTLFTIIASGLGTIVFLIALYARDKPRGPLP